MKNPLKNTEPARRKVKMAIKDWKKTKNRKDNIEFKKGKIVLEILRFSGGWVVDVNGKTMVEGKTKSQALKFAKSYMRKH